MELLPLTLSSPRFCVFSPCLREVGYQQSGGDFTPDFVPVMLNERIVMDYAEYLASVCSPADAEEIVKRRAKYDPHVADQYEAAREKENDTAPIEVEVEAPQFSKEDL